MLSRGTIIFSLLYWEKTEWLEEYSNKHNIPLNNNFSWHWSCCVGLSGICYFSISDFYFYVDHPMIMFSLGSSVRSFSNFGWVGFEWMIIYNVSSFWDSKRKLLIHTWLPSSVHDTLLSLEFSHWLKLKNNDKKRLLIWYMLNIQFTLCKAYIQLICMLHIHK